MSFYLQEQQRGDEENCTGTSNWTLNTGISRASTICCGGNRNGNDSDNDLKELKLKMATMEAKNQMLEAKLENLKLQAENRALKEESNLNKLKEENKAIRARMEAAEQKANKLETSIQEIRQEILIQRKVEVENKLEEMEEETQQQQSKKLVNPIKNGWNKLITKATIYGLNAKNNDKVDWYYVFAVRNFTISGENRQNNNFGGTIIQYFEITRLSKSKRKFYVGLSNGNLTDGKWMQNKNYYDFATGLDYCRLPGTDHPFDWPNGAIKPEWNGEGDVLGCGLLQSPQNELAIFFTGNGILMGKQIPIHSPPFDRFFPTVNLRDVSVEANFGEASDKPFKYDVKKCPGLVFE